MDNYDDDFEEEIIDESIENEQTTHKKSRQHKAQISGPNSQQDLKNQMAGRSSIRDTERKSRNGVRKAVPLSKPSLKKENEDHYAAPLKNITNKGIRGKSPGSYNDDDIEDEVAVPKRLAAVKSESPKATKTKMQRLKEFDLDSLGIKGSIDKRSSHSTPRSRISVVNFSYYERFRDILESDIYGKPIKDIEAENNKLRENLKDLNEQLTKIIERARVTTLAPKVVEFKNKNFEEKIRTTEKELNNNKQILEFTLNEYNSLKSKLDKIKGATYVLELEDKIRDAIAKTEALKKENKTLSLAAGNVAKDLHHIERADGLAPAMAEANEKLKELAVIKRKLKKVRDMNVDLEEESKTKKTRYEKAQEEYKKLYADAEQFKVTVEDNKLASKHSQLQSQVKSLEDYIKFASNNNEKYLKNQLERNIEELYVNTLKDKENMERLESMIEEQKTVLRQMIEKEEQKTDKQTYEVIQKIKNALDTGKFITEPPDFNENKPKVKSLTNIPKVPKKHQNMYADLPLFTPNGVKIDPLLNKKDLIKKEVNAIKENARKEDRSRTPEAKQLQNPDTSKPSLKSKDRDPNKLSPQAEEKSKMQEFFEEKKAEAEESSNVKPAFAKPNLMKKREPGQGGETLQMPGANQSQGNETKNLTLGGGNQNQPLTLGGNQNQPLTLGGNQPLTLGGNQNQPLTLGGNQNQPLTLGGNQNQPLTLGGNQPLTLGGNQNQPLSLGGNQNKNQNQPLTLGGGNTSSQNLTLGGNQNQPLTVGGNQPLTLGGNQTQNQPLTLGGNQNQDLKLGGNDDNFEIGGLSRLNRARRGPGGTNPAPTTQPKEELMLPGQKAAVSGAGGQQLTLPGGNTEQKSTLGDARGSPNKQPLTLGGGETTGKKEELTIKPGGRDRSHLLGNKQEDDPFGAKKESPNTVKPKTNFDPDDIFGGGNKVENKPEVSNSNTSGNALGGMGIPGARTGRGGIAGRPRQIGQDDDLFGGADTNKVVPTTNANSGFGGSNQDKAVGGFGGGGGFGGAGFGGGGGFGGGQVESNKPSGGFGGGGFGGAGGFGGGGFGGAGGFGQSEAKKETVGGESLGGDPQVGKRMRMNDLKAKGENTQEKQKVLAAKASEKGFFGDFDD